jgi:hypothetical protein
MKFRHPRTTKTFQNRGYRSPTKVVVFKALLHHSNGTLGYVESFYNALYAHVRIPNDKDHLRGPT